jgi:hypothetical protein
MTATLTPNQLKWVEALESGAFKQGQGGLAVERGDGSREYCCLGVACRLAIQDGVPITEVPANHSDDIIFDRKAGYLPRRVQKWLSVDDSNPTIGNHYAAELNDEHGLSFAEIAARVREHGVR